MKKFAFVLIVFALAAFVVGSYAFGGETRSGPDVVKAQLPVTDNFSAVQSPVSVDNTVLAQNAGALADAVRSSVSPDIAVERITSRKLPPKPEIAFNSSEVRLAEMAENLPVRASYDYQNKPEPVEDFANDTQKPFTEKQKKWLKAVWLVGLARAQI